MKQEEDFKPLHELMQEYTTLRRRIRLKDYESEEEREELGTALLRVQSKWEREFVERAVEQPAADGADLVAFARQALQAIRGTVGPEYEEGSNDG